ELVVHRHWSAQRPRPGLDAQPRGHESGGPRQLHDGPALALLARDLVERHAALLRSLDAPSALEAELRLEIGALLARDLDAQHALAERRQRQPQPPRVAVEAEDRLAYRECLLVLLAALVDAHLAHEAR